MRRGRRCHFKNCGHNEADNRGRARGERCTFYTFPQDNATTGRWLEASGIEHLTPKRVTAYNCFLCSCHFPEGKSEGPVEFVEEYGCDDPGPPEVEEISRKRTQSLSCPTGFTPSRKSSRTAPMTPSTELAVESLLRLQNETHNDRAAGTSGRKLLKDVRYSPLRTLWRYRGIIARGSAKKALQNMDSGENLLPETLSEAGDGLGVALLPLSPQTPPFLRVVQQISDSNNTEDMSARGHVRNLLKVMVETRTATAQTDPDEGFVPDSPDFKPPFNSTAVVAESPDLNNNVKEVGDDYCEGVPSPPVTSQVKKFKTVGTQCSRSFICYETARLLPEEDFKFYTGLTQDGFEKLFKLLGGDEVCSRLKYSYKRKTPKKKQFQGDMFPKDKLLMTLLRLRRGLPLRDIKILFKVSEGYASKVIYTWIRFMSLQFRKLEGAMFTSALAQNGLRPKCFEKFNNLRLILDSSEFKIQKPYNFQQQSNTYSEYKSANTLKFLIGISCFGGLSYISEGVEGSITDRQLLIKSGLLDLLDPEDAVMADKGFDAEDLFDARDLELLTPAFLGNRANFTARELIMNRAIAVSRIHVETFIGRIKEFRLVRFIIPNTMLPIASDLVRICAFLVNFQLPFIKDDDDDDK